MKHEQDSEPIAIIGIACRFPGANDYNQYWQNLELGINSISEIPPQRWDVEKYYSPNPETPNKTISKWAGLIEGIDQFDAQFFGISPREATRMDPQQRIMLELSWSCIEDAGYSPLELSGSQVGVFIGVCNYDYDQLQHRIETNADGHSGTGTWTCMLPNRISSFFNFHGPSIPIDTACSSSLAAIHYAIHAISRGECEMALVGGVSVCCAPIRYIQMSQQGMLSPTGQCRTFSADADGYVRGEGAGIITLKPLTKAIEAGDRIYGVIKGSAINHGGKARTLTSPNVYAQAQVIRSAYSKANISPNTVSYIESHGTGTPLGDPIEINALKRAYKQLYHQYGLEKTEKPYCGIGAVKSNIGHLEGAAGIAGLIKVLLAMKYKKLPKIVNFKELNPRISLKDTPFYIIEEAQEWKRLKNESGEEIPRRAGLSSFGIGGVNAHIVLEELLEEVKIQENLSNRLERPQQILTLSAQTEKALRELAIKYQTYLQSKTEASLQDICFSANTGRTHFAERLALVAKSKDELQEKLADFLQDNETNGVVRGKAESQEKAIAFLFTGQGSQYVDMGRQLYETQPTFQKILDQCNEILKEYLEIPLLEIIYHQNAQKSSISLIDQTAYTQPALFALEYALAKLWESWGIQPTVVMGHSVGEYVAACVAGVFSLEDGLKLIAMRGRLMQQLPSGGGMVSVMASESQVTEAIGEYSSQVTIAAINGAESIVISGESEAIATICGKLESIGVKTKHLQVSHAFHSPLMEPMLTEFEAVAKEVTYGQPRIPLISNVTGQKVGLEITGAEYWVGHVRQPVRFAESMKILHEQGYEVFLEIGPKSILLGMGRQCLPEDVGVWLPSLRPGMDEWQQMLESLGQLYVKGFNVDWSGFEKDHVCQKVALPTYPFQRQRYWLETSNGHPTTNSISTNPTISTQIINLLHQGKTQELSKKLASTGNLSPTEVEFIPKFLDLLRKQLQPQLAPSSIQDCLYKVEWRSQGRLGRLLPPNELLSPQEIFPQLCSTLTELAIQVDLDINQNILAHLEQLSLFYIRQALLELGWPYKPGEYFVDKSAAQRLGIVPSQRRLFNRILHILAEINILQTKEEQWQVKADLKAVSSVSDRQTLPQESVELTLLDRCASQLSKVLKGAVDPVQLVFPTGDLTTATQLYQESPTAQVMNTLVQQAITQAIHNIPPQRGIRLLEIGAGTGGTTNYILPHLEPNRTDYVFTDVGAFFTAKAQEKFQNYPFVRYKTLDIEVDPVSQGFESHQYDVIIAANVLHATANLTQTLTHVRKLLAPGGMLILLEVTTPQRWLDLVFGLLEGWWKFSDFDLRPDYPLLNRSKWQKLLSETGFSQVVTLPDMDDLCYQSVIIAQADQITIEQTEEKGKGWLILVDKQGIGDRLATKLQLDGAVCFLAYMGDRYQQVSPTEFILNPNHPEEFEQLFANVTAQVSSLSGVIQCWPLDAQLSQDNNSDELELLSKLSCGTTLLLVQALIKQGLYPVPRLWLVTQGTQPIPNGETIASGIAQTSVWGMGKVIRLEHPELNCVCVDLAPQVSVEQRATELWSEIWSQNPEDQVALRADARYVARLKHQDSALSNLDSVLRFHEDRTYLITGGLGGLGLLVAHWMVEKGARHLVLVGRRSPDNDIQQKLTNLEKTGAQIVVEIADVSNRDAMEPVFSHIGKSAYSLAGIIHAAGLLSDGVLQNQSWSSFAKVMAPKVKGAWNLHQLTQHQALDFFVLFSSVASLLGSPGQGNHSAANAFLDALAHYRRGMGLPGLSIHWGTVSEVGEAAERGADNRFQQKGLGAISPTQMLESLEILINGNGVEVGVVHIDWLTWQERVAKSPFLENWQQSTAKVSEVFNSKILQQLETATPKEQRSLLVNHVRHQLGIVLGIKNYEVIGLEDKFFELGMDSLTSVELKNKLQTSLGFSMPSTLVFDYPNVENLVSYLMGNLLEKDNSDLSNTEVQDNPDSPQESELLSQTQGLSEDELADLIDQKLNLLITE